MANVDLIEEWRIVKAYPDYEVSSLGRVRRATDVYYPNSKRKRTFAGRILGDRLDDQGRPKVTFGHNKTLRVSTLVCRAFNGPPPSKKHIVAHWDGDPKNNLPGNLRWATKKENSEDMVRHGRSLRGRANGAKLTPAIAREIIRLLARGLTQQAIADKYGVSRTSIQCINDGRSYGWLTPNQEP